ncbi:sarcosine oxidase subunit gamma [Oceaniglobus ichthyenteri]|uniref:sarcosine oxidase subunit gamma n=1 Tax=Oceaniglobus ichthyenteri TaxID=2136177 RepID=UPI000D3A8A32|nr:sarcosine oxidase subunit gamma family protein [Oceaniglobus ichthyenteri]
MSEPVSPLNGAAYDGFVSVRETGSCGMITLRGDLSDPVVQGVVKTLTGVDIPAMGKITIGKTGCAWMSPDELLLLLPRADVSAALGEIAQAMRETHHLAADVSDARALFNITGAGVRDVLTKLTPADVSPVALPVGTMRRTRLAQVPAAIWIDDETTANVICFRSVARYMFDLLCTSAKPGGAPGLFAQGSEQ